MMNAPGDAIGDPSGVPASENTTKQPETDATEQRHPATDIGFVATHSDTATQPENTTVEHVQPADTQTESPETTAKHKATYNKVGARIVDQITQLEAELPKMRQEADRSTAQFEESYGGPPPPGMFDGYANIVESRIKELDVELDQLRPPTDEDIAYRRQVKSELPKAIEANTPDELPLRFHGTTLVRTEGILTTGELSSSVDRHGAATSFDSAGAISVTSANAVRLSVREYLDLNKNEYCSPPGCLIAVLPASREDVTDGLIMKSAHFKDNPQVLFGVAASRENLDQARQWAASAGIDPGKVHEYFDFANHLATVKEQIARGEISPADILPPGWARQ
jgi:hypothetical protein